MRINFYRSALAVVFILLAYTSAQAQCSADSIIVDLTGNPDSVWSQTNVTRNGTCCGAPSNNNCYRLVLTIDKDAAGIKFDVAGASAWGAGGYTINCGTTTYGFGDFICLSGTGPHRITLCKPGNNKYDLTITSIKKAGAGIDKTVKDGGCSSVITASGYIDTSITWTAIGGTATEIATWNSYLSCTADCDTVTVTYQNGAPSYIDYEVCGIPSGGCGSSTVCDTVRVYFVTDLAVAITPNAPTICYGGLPQTLTATGSGGRTPYTYLWSTGATTKTISVSTAGTYWVRVIDSTNCGPKYDTVTVTAYSLPIEAFAGSDSNVCANAGFTLHGRVQSATGGTWVGGNGTFTPNRNTLTATYTPTTAERNAGTVTLQLVTTGNGTCPADTDAVTFTIKSRPAFSISGTTTACRYGDFRRYSTTQVAGYTYEWTASGGTITGGHGSYMIDVIWNTVGTRTLSVHLITPDGCDTTISTTVTVSAKPAPVISGSASVCRYTTGNVYSTTSNAGSSYLWTISGGSITGSNTSNSVTVKWLNNGTGTISVKETNAAGCDSTVSKSVTIKARPAPVISGSTSVCAYIGGYSYSTTNNAGSSYSWSITGGTITAGQNTNAITVSWLAAGTKSLSVTETNSLGCDTTVTATITINATPVVPALTGPDSVCQNATAQRYTSTSSLVSGYTYDWTVTGGIITGGNSSHMVDVTWGSAGTRTITVKVTNAAGCDTTVSKTVKVNAKTVPVITGSTTVCQYTSGNVYSTTNYTGHTYLWNVSNGVITAGQNTNSVTVRWLAPGTGTLTVKETNTSGCDTTVSKTITINNRAVVPALSGPDSVCQNDVSKRYTSTSSLVSGYTYEWTVTNGLITGGNNSHMVDVTWGSSGTGTISVKVTNSLGCDTTVGKTVVISPKATPSITGASSVCRNTTGNSYSVTNNAGDTYNWSITGGSITSGQGTNAISVKWNNNGTGTLTLKETTSLGCDTTVSKTITIKPRPAPSITGTATVCRNTPGFSYSTLNTAGSSFVWTISGGTITSGQNTNTVNVAWLSPGTGTISVKETNSLGCDTTVSMSVTILTRPSPSISGSTTVCRNTAGFAYSTPAHAGDNYVWTISGGTITSGQSTNAVTVKWLSAGTGVLSVKEVNNLGCDTTVSINVTINTRPVPSITGLDTVCRNTTGVSYSTTNNAGDSYLWTISGGTITAGQNTNAVTVTWLSAGTGSISVKETNSLGCDTTVIKSVTINVRPDPVITGLDTVCRNTTGVSYSTPSVAGDTFSWAISDGAITAGQGTNAVTVTWLSAGTGTLSVTETNSLGCDTTITKSVVINVRPNPIITGVDTVCENTTGISYSTPSVAGDTYNWSISGGTITAGQGSNAVTVSWLSAGTGTISVTQTNPLGCDTTITKSVTINPRPNPVISGPDTVCRNTTGVTYLITNVSGDTYNWVVTGGNITSGQGNNVINVTWLSAGTGSVYVTQTNPLGCDTTVSMSVVINVRPDPVISGLDTVCRNTTGVTYSTPNVSGDSFNWSISGGAITAGQGTNAVTVSWLSAGTGTISVTQTNPLGCDTTVTKSVTINVRPDPVITGLDTVCRNTTGVSYSTPTAAGDTYLWSISGGTITAGQGTHAVTVTWLSAGTGTISVKETNSLGCDTTIVKSVTINVRPDPVITGLDTVCRNTTGVSYSTPNVAGDTYNWAITDGSITSGQGTNTVTVTWLSAGTGTLSVTEANSLGCDTTIVKSVVINVRPDPVITGVDTICRNTTGVSYSTPSVAGDTYSWAISGGTITAGQSTNAVTVSWLSAGTGTISVTQTNPLGCDTTVTKSVTINPRPDPVINGPDTVCRNTTGVAYFTPNVGGDTYSWSITGGTITAGQGNNAITVTWLSTGTGTLSVKQTNPLGCDTTITLSVVINARPDPAITGPDDICRNTTGVHYSTPSNAGDTYVWSISGGTITAGQNTNAVEVTWLSAGSGSISVQETNSLGCDTTITKSITIDPRPDPVITGLDTVCRNTTGVSYSTPSVAGDTYLWSISGGTITAGQGTHAVTVTWLSAGTGTISIKETNSFGCDTTIVKSVTINVRPDPVITGLDTVCRNTTGVSYSTPNVAGDTYNWAISGGTITAGQGTNAVTVTWLSAGTGTISVTEANSLGCDTTIVKSVTINVRPDPVITGLDTVCRNTTGVSYSTPSVSGDTYNWSISDGTITAGQGTNAVTVTWLSSGTGTISVTQTNPLGCDTTITKSVTINVRPDPVITGLDTVCRNTTGVAYSTPNAAGDTYAWTITGGTITAGQNTNAVTVTWLSAGTGTLSVKETNSLGCDTTIVKSVVINVRPDPIITGLDTVCRNTTGVNYSTPNVSGDTYSWAISGGSITAGQGTNAVTVTWLSSGTGTLSVTEANSLGCDTTIVKSVVINVRPDPVITGLDTVCRNTTGVSYSTPAAAGDTYSWSISGGTITAGQGTRAVTVTWLSAGTGTISVTETNSLGCDTTITKSVTINVRPDPVITGLDTVCRNTTGVSYSTPNVAGDTYNWAITGGTITAGQGTNAVTVTWLSAGTGTLSVTEANSLGCDTTIVKSVTINVRPDPVITGLDTVCRNTTGVSYSTPNVAGDTYSWTISGGTITAGQSTNAVTVSWLSAGTGTISVTQTNPLGCDTTITKSVTINVRPDPVINGLDTVCRNTTGVSYSTPNVAGDTYAWTISGGTITAGQNTNAVTVTWLSSGTGTLSVKETNSLGCDTTIVKSVTINVRPDPAITGPDDICRNTTGVHYSTPSNAGDTYVWSISGGTITAGQNTNAVEVTWLSAGSGSISVQETNSLGCDTTITKSIIIDPRPDPVITGLDTVCRNTTGVSYSTPSVSGDTYSWSISGGTITGGQSTNAVTVTWLSSGTGTLSVTETNSLGCDTTIVKSVTINVRPDPVITGLDTVCRNTTGVSYSTPNVAGDTYSWAITGGTITAGQNTNAVTVTWLSAGTGTLSVTEANPLGCDTTIVKSVTINVRPDPIITGLDTVCRNTTGVSYSTPSVAGDTYAWAISGGTITAGQNTNAVTVTWLSSGTGTISVTQTNPLGCDTTITKSVTINVRPDPVITGLDTVCRNTTGVNYSTPNVAGDTYSWSISGGSITAGQGTNAVTVTWLSSGTGTLSVKETNSLGCDTTITKSVTINVRPDPVITGLDTVCRNTTGVSYSTPSVAGDTYSWAISGGTITAGQNTNAVTVTWLSAGTGTLSVTETNSLGCDTTIVKSVTINVRPDPAITGLDTVCRNTSGVSYSTPSVAGDTYSWSISGGTITAGQGTRAVTVSWLSAGTGSISVTETNSLGCDTTITKSVTINVRPDPVITGLDTVCRNTTGVSYSTPSVAGDTYSWAISGGTITAGQNTNAVTVTWLSAGTGTLSVTETNSLGCDTTITKSVTINVRPNPVITGLDTVCRNTTGVSYSTPSVSGDTYSWSISGGSITAGQNTNAVTVTWLSSGTGTISVTQANSLGCDTTITKSVTINVRPDPVITGLDTVCRNTTGVSYSTPNVAGDTYSWSISGGSITAGQGTNAVTVTWLSSGTGMLSVKETNSLGCDTTIVKSVTINVRPDPAITGLDTVCRNTTGVAYSTPSVSGDTYNWTISGGSITAGQGTNAVTVTWLSAGTGTISVQETNSLGCDTTITKSVVINVRPDPVISGSSTVCRNSTGHSYSTPSVSGDTYSWSISGGTITSGQNTNAVTVTWLSSGTGTLSVTEANSLGCDTTIGLSVTINVRPAPAITGADSICQYTNGIAYSTPVHVGSTYSWSISGGTITSGQNTDNVVVSWGAAGTGTISVTETNNLGCDTVATKSVRKDPWPLPVISGPDTVCRNTSGHVYSTPNKPGASYTWFISGGNITSGAGTNSVTVKWLDNGIGTISVQEISALGCDTTVSYDVVIKARPVPSISGSTTVCRNTTGNTYSTPSHAGSTYVWSISGGNITSGQNTNSVSVTWLTNGTGSISVTETNSLGCDTTVTTSITINARPAPAITGADNICRNTTLVSYSTTSNAGSSYVWSITGGIITAGQNTNAVGVTWLSAGTGTISVKETNSLGCDTTVTKSVTINVRPDPIITGLDTVCRNTTGVSYSTPSVSGDTYSWSITGGTITGGQNTNAVTVTWLSAGTGTISVQETNSIGCDTTITKSVTINVRPDPIITGLDTVCRNTTGIGYSTPSVAGDTYSWSITGGTITGGQNTNAVTVTWLSAGTGTISVKETNSLGCDTTITKSVTIDVRPDPVITGLDTVCRNTTGVSYSTPSVSGDTYSWSITDGTITSGQGTNAVTVTWLSSGTGTISVHESNSLGCDTTITKNVTINVRPDPAITGLDTVCRNTTGIGYSTPSVSGDTYNWSISGGTITAGQGTNSVTVTWLSAGTGTISVQETNSLGCDTTITKSVIINTRPVPAITGADDICRNTTLVSYSTTNNAGSSYVWSITGGVITAGQNTNAIAVTWLSAGTGTLSVKETNSLGCDTTVTKSVTINPRPDPVITGLDTVCRNTTGVSYSTPSVSGDSYAWTISGGTITAGQNTNAVTVTWLSSGTGTISVKETNSIGCDTTIVKTVTINVRPDPIITGLDTICRNTTGVAYSTPNVATDSYNWFISGGTITAGQGTNAVTVTWLGAGTGTISVTQTNPLGCDTTITKSVTINVRPDPVITGLDTVCRNTTGVSYSTPNVAADSYSWAITGGTITAGQNTNAVTVTWLSPGTGTLSVTQTNPLGCDTTITKSVTINVRPDPVITGLDTVCRNTTGVSYSTPNVASDSFNWSISGGTITAGQGTNAVTVTWLSAGTGTISVTQRNPLGCDTTITKTVTINTRPAPAITGADDICRNTTLVSYSTTGNAGSSYVWSITGGVITAGQNTNAIAVTWLSAGTGTLSVKETNSLGCDTTVTKSVTINPRPDPVITGLDTVCRNTTGVSYSTPSVLGDTYAWTISGGTITAGQNTNAVTVTWLSAGTGKISVKETNSIGCDTTIVKTVTINVRPDPIITGLDTICRNTTGVPYSTPNVAGDSYSWSISGGTITAGQGTNAVTVSWLGAGTGTLSVTETNPLGCDTTIVKSVTINVRPDPIITGVDTICRNTTGVAYSTPSVAGDTYSWAITGGTITAGQNTNAVTVTWLSPGTGTLSVTQTNPLGCDTTIVKSVTINVRPDPIITGLDTVCRNTTGVSYSTPNVANDSFNWSISGGTITAGQGTNAVTVTWLSAGTGTISVTQRNPLGCDTTITKSVTINVRPDPVITGVDTICRNTTGVAYSTPSVAGDTYSWSISGGTITAGQGTNAVTVTWLSPGTGTLSVTQTNPLGCDTTITKSVTINVRPDPVITGLDTVCRNTTGVSYSTPNVAADSYNWTISGGTITAGQGTNAVTVTWLSAGTGTISVTQTNPLGCDTTIVKTVTINTRPVPVISGATTVCRNTSGNVYSTTNTSGDTYFWTISGGTITSGQNTNSITVKWLDAGTGTLAVKETNSLGCDTTVSINNITINPRPVPVITGIDTVCRNTTGITYSTPSNSGDSYTWAITNGVITAGQNTNSVTVSWLSTGTGTISVTEANSLGCDTTIDKTVTINARPDPVIAGSSTVCRNSTGHSYSTPNVVGDTYLWSVSGGIITSGQNTNAITVTWLSTGTGTISVQETNPLGCDTTIAENITINTRPAPAITGVDSICQFTAGLSYSTPSHAGSSYVWTISGGAITAGQNTNAVTVNWHAAGIGTITVTETNSLGCDTVATKTVRKDPYPLPQTNGPDTVCRNTSGHVYYTPKKAGSQFTWSIVGGIITSGQNTDSITVTWLGNGTGTISVNEISASGCDTTIFKNVTIKARRVPSISGSGVVCRNSTGHIYTTPSHAGSSYAWSITGGMITAGQNTDSITVSWLSPGTGTLTVMETNSLGCDTTISRNITINTRPLPVITGVDTICRNTTGVTYSTPNNAGAGYVWSIVNGVITAGQNTNAVTVTWLSAGTGTISVKETNSLGCDTTIDKTVVINTRPVPVITGVDTICRNTTGVTYSTPVNSGDTYAWSITGGTITSRADSNGVTVTWLSAGTGTLSVQETNSLGCDTTIVKTVIINTRPTPSISGPDTVCRNSTGHAYSTTSNAGNTYFWTVTGGTITAGQNTNAVTVSWLSPGTGTISVKQTNTLGCDTTVVKSVTINTRPDPAITGLDTVCRNTTGIAYSTPSNAGDSYTWFITGGNITAGQNTNAVTVTWLSAGTGTISVQETNSLGCDTTIVKSVTIHTRPVPTISGPGTVCRNSTGHVYSTPSNSGDTYFWAVTGGTITAGQNTNSVTVSWLSPGTGTISVKETNSLGCDTTIENNVTINTRPVPVITGKDTVCRNTTGVTYSTPNNAGAGYVWAITNGVITAGQNTNAVTVTWLSTGTGTLSVKETNSLGCDTTIVKTVVINARPDPVITGKDTICRNTTGVTYSTPVKSGDTYAWSITGGTITSRADSSGVTVTWLGAGTGTLSVKETNSLGCDTTIIKTVIINTRPVPSISGPGTVCRNTTGNSYSTANNAGNSYFWTISGGTITAGQNTNAVTVTWLSAGTGTLSVKQTNTLGCDTTVTKSVTINTRPVPVITGKDTICRNTTGVTYSTPSNSGDTYTWSITGGTITAGQNTNEVTVTWLSAGTGTISVKEANSLGCDTTIVKNVKINTRPVPSISGLNTVCRNTTGISYSTANNAGDKYFWSITGGTITAGQNTNVVTVTWLSAGTGTLSVQETNSLGCDTTIVKNVTINTRPLPVITGKDTVCRNTTGVTYSTPSNAGDSYLWSITNGTITAGQTTNAVTVTWLSTGSGTLSVKETNSLGCDTTIVKKVIINKRPDPAITGKDTICRNTAGVTYSTPVQAGDKYLWSITGGNITSRKDSNGVTVTWLSAGTGTLSVQETNSLGCDTTIIKKVIINTRPVPAIVGKDTICRNTAGVIYSTANNSGDKYAWTIAGGIITSGQNTDAVTVSWLSPGTGTLSVTETNSLGCDTTVIKKVVINTRPDPIVKGPDTVCRNSIGHIYTTPKKAGDTYAWTISGGIITSGQNTDSITVTWLAVGTGTLSVKETNKLGCDTTIIKKVIINTRPAPFLTGNTTVCRNSSGHTYRTNAITGNTYNWSITGGQITAGQGTNEVTVTWFNDGTGTITVKETNKLGCDTTDKMNVTINARSVSKLTGEDTVCRNSPGHIYSITNNLGSLYAWSIKGGIITAGQGTDSINVVWLEAGTGNITVTEVNSFGCDTVISRDVVIHTRPTPKLTGPGALCRNTAGVVYSTPAATGDSYSWVVNGSGLITSGQGTNSITVTWLNPGAGSVTLQEANKLGCDTTIVLPVTVSPRPDITLFGSTTVCENMAPITYFVNPQAGVTYQWKVTGGVLLSNANASSIYVAWPSKGIGSVEIYSKNQYGCDTFVKKIITINARPIVTLKGSQTTCVRTLETYTANLSDATTGGSYAWTVTGGAIVAESATAITVNWASSGTVTYYKSNSLGCDTIVKYNVTVMPKPDVTLSGPLEVCSYKVLTYSVPFDPLMKYQWTVQGGIILSDPKEASIAIHWGTPGAGKIKVTAQNSVTGCSDTTSVNVLIKDGPAPVISGLTSNCERVFSANYSTPFVAGHTYSWTATGGTIVNGQGTGTVFVTWDPTTDEGELTVTESTPTGCDSTARRKIKVGYMETSISASATEGCAPAIIIFDAALSESAVKYEWDFGDGTKGPDKKSAVHRYEIAGVYKVRVVVTYEKGCVDTAFTTVTVFPGPDARFKIQYPSNEGVFYAKEDSAVFINTSTPDAIRYFWDFGDGYTSTDKDGHHMYEHTGKYPVKLVIWNENGCKDSLILEVVVRMHATIFVPNAFTPDDNRINELFYVETYNITEFEIIIINRWGEVIFESKDKNFRWDGRFRGQLVQQDVYVYYIKARSLDGEFLKRYGTITVLR